MANENLYKLKTYKRINRNATIYGFPFSVFFVLFLWVLIFIMIIINASFIMKIVALIIGLAGIGGITYIFKTKGIKNIQKSYDLYFKKIDVIKINEQIIIKKKKMK